MLHLETRRERTLQMDGRLGHRNKKTQKNSDMFSPSRSSKPSQTFRCTFSLSGSMPVHSMPVHSMPMLQCCHYLSFVTGSDSCRLVLRCKTRLWLVKFILCSLAWDSSRVHEISVLKEESKSEGSKDSARDPLRIERISLLQIWKKSPLEIESATWRSKIF